MADDVHTIKLILAYLESQPIARTEQGEPDAFSDPLEDVLIEQLRIAPKRIK